MSHKEKDQAKTTARKEILKAVSNQLSISLTGLKDQLSDKKFKKRIKKVARLLTNGVKKIPAKKTVPTGKTSTATRRKTVKILPAK